MSIAADPMRPANRRARTSLLASCAVAAALGVQGPAVRAQSYQGTVTGAVNAIVGETPGRTTVTVTAPTATVDWTATGRIENGQRIFQDPRTTAVFESRQGDYTVLNRINPGAGNPPIRLDGTTLSYVGPETGGVRGGTVWFYSPGGIALGPNGVIDVGSLVLTANDIAVTTVAGQPVFTDAQGNIRFRSTDANSRASIDIAGQLSAIGEGSYIALVAPRINQAGTVEVNGSAAYVAAQQADIRINGGLFDITIPADGGSPVTTAGETVLSHTGTTSGPGSSGAGDNHVTYFVAMPKNDVVSMLVGGSVGYRPVAEGVTVENGVVVLAAGGNIRTNPDGDAEIPVLVDIPVTTTIGALARLETTSATSRILGVASDGITASVGSNGSASFTNDVTLIGGRSASFDVTGGSTATIGGSLTVRSTGITTLLGSLPGTAGVTVTGATLNVGGSLAVNASNLAGNGGSASFTLVNGTATIGQLLAIQADGTGVTGDVVGGSALFDTDQITRVSAGNLVMTADAQGANGANGGEATGGSVTIDSYDSELRFGSTTLSANGIGGASANGGGGDGNGGTIFAEVDVGGVQPGDEIVPGLFNEGGFLAQANGIGGGQFCGGACPPATAPGGGGLGGSVRVEAAGGQLVASFIDLRADGDGGAGGDVGSGSTGGTGGAATGGRIDLLATGGELRASFANVQANGSGGSGSSVNEVGYGQLEPGIGGAGGRAEGGRVVIDASAGQVLVDSIFASADGRGGSGGEAETGGAGGAGQGGNALVSATGGTISGSSLFVSTAASGGSGGRGLPGRLGAGGAATGGTADVLISSGSITASSLSIDSFTRGGSGGLDFDSETGEFSQGAGGDATGGTARLTLLAGGTGSFDFVDIRSFANGGFAGVDSTAGRSIGGTSQLASTDAALTINSALTVDASVLLDGGESGGSDAVGSTAGITLTRGSFTYGGDSLIVRADAVGGFQSNGDAGSATGGTASLGIDGISLTLPGTVEISADARTQSSDVVGAARGGSASLSLAGGAQLESAGRVIVSASGTGGSSPDQVAAPAGSGAGGTARLVVTDATLITDSDLTVRAAGTGGDAMEAGAGGAGAGGAASVQLSSADDSGGISASLVRIDGSGVGGTASSTFSNGVTGGAGGSGSGGSAALSIAGGTLTTGQTNLTAAGSGGRSFNSGPGGASAGGTARIDVSGRSTTVVDFGSLGVSVTGIGGGTSEDGYGVPAGPSGGSGAGGDAAVSFTGATVLASAITIDASATGAAGGANRQGGAGGAGGTATGGSAILATDGGLTANEISLFASGRGGSGGSSDSDATGVAGSGTGGIAQLTATGATLSISETLRIEAQGIGGSGSGAASGTGGTARASLAVGEAILPGALSLLAGGSGGGIGGSATGGAADFTLTTGTITLESLTLDASASGADGFFAAGAAGGAAQGGTANLIVADGGALTVNGDLRVTSAARGGDANGVGGAAVGGNVSVLARGGTIASSASLSADSSGTGGTGAAGGGAGTGGRADLRLEGSLAVNSRIELGTLSIGADGTGGGVDIFSSLGGNGGAGQGGTVTLSANAGTLALTGGTTASASGSGGSGGGNGTAAGIGGTGTGGKVLITTSGITLDAGGDPVDLEGTLDFAGLDVNIAGFGGGGSDFGYGTLSGVAGGAGIGGSATFDAAAGRIEIDTLAVQARGAGGNANRGQGETATGNDGGFARGGSIAFRASSGDLAIGGASITATAQGGNASTGSAGGNGGAASGGSVAVAAAGGSAAFESLTARIRADGGNGANGSIGAGGDGGSVVGGSFSALASGETLLALNTLTVDGFATAGNGGNGDAAARGGAGGAGGSATGASIAFTAREGGTLDLAQVGDGALRLDVGARGGDGGIGGDGSDFGDAGGVGGHGGGASGGSIALQSFGGTIGATSLELVADADGGSGGGGGTGQTRPFVPGDPGDPNAEPPIPPTPPIPEIPAVRAAGGGSGQGSGGSILLAASDFDGGEGAPLLGSIVTGFVSASASGSSGQDGDGFFYGGAAGRLTLEARGAAAAGAIRTSFLSASLFGFDPGEGAGFSVLADNSLIDLGSGAQIFSGGPITIRAAGTGQLRGTDIALFGDSFVDIAHDRGETTPEIPSATIAADSLFVSAAGSIFGGRGSVIDARTIGLRSQFGEVDVDTLRGVDSIDIRAAGNVRIQRASVTGDVFIDDGAESGGEPSLRGGSITVVAGEQVFPTFAAAGALGPADITIGESLSATGTIDLAAGRDILIGDGVTIASNNRITLAAGDDILLAAGSTLSAALDPVADQAPPGGEDFDNFAGLTLSAGELPINYQPESGNVASVVTRGAISSGDRATSIVAGAVDARGSTLAARSLRVGVIGAPAPGSARSDDGGQLSPDCLQGAACLGTIAISNVIEIGGPFGDAGDLLPTDLSIGAGGFDVVSASLRAKGDIRLGFDGGEGSSQFLAQQLLVQSTDGGLFLNAGSTLGGTGPSDTLLLTATGIEGSGATLTAAGNLGIAAGSGGLRIGALDVEGSLDTVDAGGGLLRAGELTVATRIDIEDRVRVAGSNLRLIAAEGISIGTVVPVTGRSLQLTSSGGEVVVGDAGTDGEATLASISISGTSVQLGRGDSESGITLTSTGGDIVTGPLDAGSILSINSAGAIQLETASAGSFARLRAAGAISATAIDSANFLDVDGASIDIGTILAGGDVQLDAPGLIRIGQSTSGNTFRATGGELALGPITVGGDGSEGFGDRSIIASSAGALSIDAGSALDDIFLNAGDAIQAGALAAGGGIDVSNRAGAITVQSANAGGNLAILAEAGAITTGDLTSGGTITLRSLTDGITTGQLTAFEDIFVTAAGLADLGLASAGDDILIRAAEARIAGAIADGSGPDNADGGEGGPGDGVNILVETADAGIDLGSARSAGSIRLDARGPTGGIVAGDLVAGTQVDARATGAIRLADVSAGSSALIVSDTGPIDAGTIDAGGTLTLGGSDVSVIDASAGGNAFVTAPGVIDFSSLIAGGNLVIEDGAITIGTAEAGGALVANGTTVSIERATTTGLGIGQGEGGLPADASIFVTARSGDARIGAGTSAANILVDASGGFTSDTLVAAGGIDLVAGGDVALGSAGAGAALDIESGGSLTASGLLEGGSFVSLLSAGSIDVGSARSGGDLLATARDTLSIGPVAATLGFIANGTSIALGDVTAGDDILLTASAGDITAGSLIASGINTDGGEGGIAGSNIRADAAGGLSIGRADAADDVIFVARSGAIVSDSINAGGLFSASGGAIEIGAIDAGRVTIAGTGPVTIGGGRADGLFTVTTSGDFTGDQLFGNAIDIDAGGAVAFDAAEARTTIDIDGASLAARRVATIGFDGGEGGPTIPGGSITIATSGATAIAEGSAGGGFLVDAGDGSFGTVTAGTLIDVALSGRGTAGSLAARDSILFTAAGAIDIGSAVASGPVVPGQGQQVVPAGSSVALRAGFNGDGAAYSPADLTVTGLIDAAGTVLLEAGRDGVLARGADVRSDNAVTVRAGDDILVGAGASLRGAVSPIADFTETDGAVAPSPARIDLSAGQLAVTGGAVEGNVASIIVDGTLAAPRREISFTAGAIQTGSIDARGITADIIGAPALTAVASNDGGQLRSGCEAGNICFGPLPTLFRGVAIGQTGRPNDVRIEGGFSGIQLLIRANRDITLGSEGSASTIRTRATTATGELAGLPIGNDTTAIVAGRDIRLLGDLTLAIGDGPGGGSGTRTDLVAGGSLIGADASVSSNRGLNLSVGGDLLLQALRTAGTVNTVNADGVITGTGFGTVGGGITLQELAIGAGTAAFRAGGDILIDRLIAGTGQGVVLTSTGGDVRLGNLIAQTGASLIRLTGADVTLGSNADLSGDLTISATGLVTLLDARSSSGDIDITAGDTITGGALRAEAGDLRAAGGGTVTLATANAGGDLMVASQRGAVSIGGDSSAGGALSLFAAEDVSAGNLRSNASLAASSRNGRVTLGNAESVGGFVRIGAANAIRLGNVRAAGSIFVTGTGTIDAGDLTAGTGPLLDGVSNGGSAGGTDPATTGIAPGFDSFFVPRCDDCFTSAVDLPFDVNYFGQTYGDTFVSNNGYITFRAGQGTFTPSGLGADYRGLPIIAAFFADIDTRNAASAQTSYGAGTFAGRNAFGVTYNGVGYFSGQADKLNNLQLILTDRGDTGTGNFDIYFNYTNITWETGSASGGTNGFGGVSAAVGYNAGTGGQEGTFFELPGSRVVGSFLNGGPAPLVQTTNNGNPGQLLFTVRNGMVSSGGQAEPPTVHVINTAATVPADINVGNISAEAVEVRGSAAVTVGAVNVGDRGSPIEAIGPAFATVLDAQSGLFAGEITGNGFVALGNAAGLLRTGAITTPSSVLVLADGSVELGAVTAGAGATDSLFVGSQSLLGAGQALDGFAFGGVLGGSFDPATLATLTPTAAGAALRLGGPIRAGNILLGSGASLDLAALNASGGVVRTASGGDTLLGGAVTAATDVSILSNGLIRVNGDVLGNAIDFTSADIAIGSAVTIGRGAASQVRFINGSTANRMFIGAGGSAGYTIDAVELGAVRARTLAFASPAAQQGGDPEIVIGDLTITGSAATADPATRTARLFGENAAVSVQTPGRIRVVGDVAFGSAAAADTLSLAGGQRVELITNTGSIRLGGSGDALSGRLVLQSSEVFSGSSEAAAAIANAADLDARSARLAQVDGGLRPEGYLQAGALEFRIRNALYIQNSGVQGSLNFADRAGFTAGSGGVTIVTTGSGPAAVAINGRQVSATGFTTGVDLIPLLTVRGSDSQTGSLDPRATANGCLIANVASCVFTPEPEFVPIFFPPVQDTIREALAPEVIQSGEASEFAITTLFDLPLIELPNYGTFSFAPLIDEPVTGAGNEDLWGEDDDEDDATP